MANLTVTAASVEALPTSAQKTGIAGETITAGQPLYYSAADQRYYKASSTTATTANAAGIALNGAAAAQPIAMLTAGPIDIGATVTVGEVYVVSDTAGSIAAEIDSLEGEFITVLGVGVTTANINVAINASGIAHAAIA